MRAWSLPLLLAMASGCASRGWDRVDIAAFSREPAAHPDDKVLVLLDEVRARYFAHPSTGEATLDETHHVRKLVLRETEDVDVTGVVHDPIFHVLQDVRARVIRPDGSVEEFGRERAVSVSSFAVGYLSDYKVMALRLGSPPVGSVVEWEYTLRSPGRLFTASQELWSSYPSKVRRLVVEIPEGWTLERTPRGEGVPEAVVSREGGVVRHTWELRDLPAMHGEPLAGEWEGPQISARLDTWTERGEARHKFRDAREVSSFVYQLYKDPPPPDAEMKALVQKVMAETAEPRERARRLHDWVRDEVKYCAIELGWGGFRPIEAGVVFRGRYGDCKGKANLLHVLLAEAGIRSRHLLVFHHGAGGAPRPFRMENGMFNFNHAILEIDLPGGPLVVDPTSNETFGDLPLGDQEADLLPLADPGADLIKARSSTPADNVIASSLELRMDRDGDVQGAFLADVRGGMRQAVEDRLRDAGKKKVEESVGAALGPVGVDANLLDDVEFTGGRGDPLRIAARMSMSRFASHGAGVLMLRLSEARRALLPVLPDEPRRTPVVLGHRRTMRERVQLELPPATRVTALPAPARVAGPGLEYDLRWTEEGGKVVAERTLVVKDVQVPASSYAEVREASRKIHVAEAQAVLLEVKR